MISAVYGRQSLGKKKSIADQLKLGVSVARERDWSLAPEHMFQDSTSASRFASKARDDWPRVRSAVRSGEMDVLILWESSRGDREPETWLNFLSDCRRSEVKIYVIENERLYDMSVISDWEALATEGIKNAVESEKISKRVRRGHAGSAEVGRPSHGRAPYGYRRTYDPSNGELIGQEPDPATAPIVRDIFTKIAEGYAINEVSRQTGLYPVKIRNIALNPAYIALRVYNGQTYPGTWPRLVEPEVFYAVQRILSDPARTTTNGGRQKWLLSGLACCGVCGTPLTATKGRWYRCALRGCVRVVIVGLDDWIRKAMIAYLSQPAVYKGLAQEHEQADREVTEARTEAAQLRAELNQWRESAIKGVTTPESLAAIEAGLSQRIRAADKRAQDAEVPAALRGFVGPGVDVAERWDNAPLPARRALLRRIMVIKVNRSSSVGRFAGRFDPDRIVIERAGAAAGSQPAHRRSVDPALPESAPA